MAKMAQQIELFDDGGLMDEGGTTDPVSGNDVPPGSTQEEVRDDIPAQLSEGEFVIPADVVRYIGLENLMRMRQEAKQGLAEMEAMGQMGNSEEAVMPDDLPFDEYDLEVEDDGQDELNFQVGGFVPPSPPNQINPITGVYQTGTTGITGYQGYQGQPTGFTPYGGVTPFFQPAQFTGPQYTTALQTTNLPTFAETVGTKAGQYDELRTYQNEAGQTLQIPFKNGQPIYPIPEGYKPMADQPKLEEEIVPSTLGQTQVKDMDDSGGDGSPPKPEDYGGEPGSFFDPATTKGLSMFSKSFSNITNPFDDIGSAIKEPANIASFIAGLINPVVGLVARGVMSKSVFDSEIARLAEDYSFFTEKSLRAELGNMANASADYAKAAATIESASATVVEKEAAQTALNKAREDFSSSAARASGVTDKAEAGKGGKAGIEASGIAPGPGARLSDKGLGLKGTAESAGLDYTKTTAAEMAKIKDTTKGGAFTKAADRAKKSTSDPSGGDVQRDDDGAFSGLTDRQADAASGPSRSGGGGYPGDKSRFKSGGLAKQMKRSGLASKK